MRCTVFKVFFFPDKKTQFDFFDDITAGFKCFIAVARPDADPDSRFSDADLSCPLNADRIDYREFGNGFLDDLFAFGAACSLIGDIEKG